MRKNKKFQYSIAIRLGIHYGLTYRNEREKQIDSKNSGISINGSILGKEQEEKQLF